MERVSILVERGEHGKYNVVLQQVHDEPMELKDALFTALAVAEQMGLPDAAVIVDEKEAAKILRDFQLKNKKALWRGWALAG